MCNLNTELVVLRLSFLVLILRFLEPMPVRADEPTASGVVLETKGYLVPASQVAVSPRVSGQVVELLIEEGKQVKAGDVLARLDPTEYGAALRAWRSAEA